LKRKRKVIITYIYLKPEYAWQYTQGREEEGRRILKETFIQKYIGAYDTVRYIRNRFSSEEVEILLVNKINMISNDNIDIINIISADQLDERLEKVYNKDELENLL